MQKSSSTSVAISQHNAEIHENLRHWKRKPLLQQQYRIFYQEIAKALQDIPNAPVLECGSGIGNIKSVFPDAITSDLFENPWLDRKENIYALSFQNSSLGGVVLFDVFHHLEYPGNALNEVARVLKPKGRVVIFEPAAGLLGRLVLGLFHHEPLSLRQAITWTASPGFNPTEANYYAAQGNAWRVFGTEMSANLGAWRSPTVNYYPSLLWLLTGGFRGPSLCPMWLAPLVNIFDRILLFAPKFFSSRMLIVLELRE